MDPSDGLISGTKESDSTGNECSNTFNWITFIRSHPFAKEQVSTYSPKKEDLCSSLIRLRARARDNNFRARAILWAIALVSSTRVLFNSCWTSGKRRKKGPFGRLGLTKKEGVKPASLAVFSVGVRVSCLVLQSDHKRNPPKRLFVTPL